MNQKYYNDAIIGNKNLKATFSSNGELLRLYYPTVDFKQFIDFFREGIKVNDSGIIYLSDDINNKYKQYYTEDTNILNTEIDNTYFNLKIKQTDYVTLKENILVKKYVLKNDNKVELDIDFLIHSKLLSNDNNMVSAREIRNGLIQYSHDYSLSIFSNQEIDGHRINDTDEYIKSGILQDKDYIGMSSDSSISYQIGKLKPGESKEINIYILVNSNSELKNMEELSDNIERIKKIDLAKEENQVRRHWKKYVQEHSKIDIQNISGKEKILKIYKRTILLFALLQNEETGGIAATIEIDEKMQKSGRYSYCWPRDAVFITKAFDELGMNRETEKFYKIFCKNAQSKNGMWEQRFYTDGRLAPCWGYQIDETASVIYGIYEHYKIDKDKKFLLENYKMCENAMHFLLKYLANIFEEKEEIDLVKKDIEEKIKLSGKEKDEVYKHKSYDLWEMNEGIHLYSLATIYAAFSAMIEINEIVKEKYQENRLKIEQMIKNTKKMQEEIENIKKYISNNMYDENCKILHRNCEDAKMDVSIVGAITPFELFTPKDRKVLNTIEKINMTLRTYTGGYIRFEEDSYMKGANPWPIATLWMALYYIKSGEKQKAKECFDFVTNTSTDLGFLGEQVDNNTMKSNWIIGLGWSHAMYIITLVELIKIGI